MRFHEYATAFLLILMAVSANANDDLKPLDTCKDFSLIARDVMAARQKDVPMSQAIPMAAGQIRKWLEKNGREIGIEDVEEGAAQLVMDAYNRTIESTDSYKRLAITDFENVIFKECYKEMTADLETESQVDDYEQHQERIQRLRRELEAEQRAAELAADRRRAAAVNSPEMFDYQFAVAQKIRRNWSIPPSADSDTFCVVRVRQTMGGDVLSVIVVSCNGGDAVRRSVEAAVYKASPLPQPDNPDLFYEDLELNLRVEQ